MAGCSTMSTVIMLGVFPFIPINVRTSHMPLYVYDDEDCTSWPQRQWFKSHHSAIYRSLCAHCVLWYTMKTQKVVCATLSVSAHSMHIQNRMVSQYVYSNFSPILYSSIPCQLNACLQWSSITISDIKNLSHESNFQRQRKRKNN
jgi:hypothetical protein